MVTVGHPTVSGILRVRSRWQHPTPTLSRRRGPQEWESVWTCDFRLSPGSQCGLLLFGKLPASVLTPSRGSWRTSAPVGSWRMIQGSSPGTGRQVGRPGPCPRGAGVPMGHVRWWWQPEEGRGGDRPGGLTLGGRFLREIGKGSSGGHAASGSRGACRVAPEPPRPPSELLRLSSCCSLWSGRGNTSEQGRMQLSSLSSALPPQGLCRSLPVLGSLHLLASGPSCKLSATPFSQKNRFS